MTLKTRCLTCGRRTLSRVGKQCSACVHQAMAFDRHETKQVKKRPGTFRIVNGVLKRIGV